MAMTCDWLRCGVWVLSDRAPVPSAGMAENQSSTARHTPSNIWVFLSNSLCLWCLNLLYKCHPVLDGASWILRVYGNVRVMARITVRVSVSVSYSKKSFLVVELIDFVSPYVESLCKKTQSRPHGSSATNNRCWTFDYTVRHRQKCGRHTSRKRNGNRTEIP